MGKSDGGEQGRTSAVARYTRDGLPRSCFVGAGLMLREPAALIEPASLDGNLLSWFAEAGIP